MQFMGTTIAVGLPLTASPVALSDNMEGLLLENATCVQSITYSVKKLHFDTGSLYRRGYKIR